MSRKTVLLSLLMGCLCYAPDAFAAEPNDYIIPGKSYMLEGTLSGLRLAYETFDNGINDQACPDCSTNRELIFLHAVTRSAMLFIDNNDVLADSFLELAQQFGITLTGDYFVDINGLIDVNDLVDVNVALDANGYYRIPPEAPNAVEVGEIIHYSIIPEINDIIAELDLISDSPSDRFRIFFEPNQTGLQNDLEVDYGEVLILRALLLAFKGQLEAKLAYDVFVDVNEELMHKLLYEEGIDVNDSNVVDLFVVLDVNDPNNPNINEDFLNRYPYLLTVLPAPGHEEDGAAILAQAAQDWIDAIDYYFNAIDYIRSEDDPPGTDPQEDELLYIDPNDEEVLDNINARLTTLRDSLINDTVDTYPWETSNTYYLEDPCSTITWELMLNYDIVGLPTDEPGSFVASDSNGMPSPWEVTDISIDGNEIILEMDYDVPGYWGGALFTGMVSDDGNSITNGTFEYWGPDYGTIYNLSGQLVYTEVVERQLDLNPVFGSSSRYPDPVNPRDLLPEFDDKNMPISATFGHGLNDDPTFGGILPGMTQEEWAILFDLPVPGLRFYEQLRLAVGDSPQSVALGDINGDGILDIVTANTYSNDVSVLLGLGDGSFGPQTRFGIGDHPESVVLGDLDGNGTVDIVTANSGSNDISVLLGLSDGSFQSEQRFGVGHHPTSLSLGDLNGDGMLDVVTANCWSANISVLLGLGNGSFRPQATFAVGYGPHSVALGDFDGDSVLDLVTANSWSNTISVLLGVGDGSFEPQTMFVVGSGPHSFALGDLNLDGVLDIVAANRWSEDISVLLGLGDGSFQTQFRFDVGDQPQSLSLGDINGDGVLDVVTANPWDDNISVLLGLGDGGFGRPSRFDVENVPLSVGIGDLNGDGILDIITANIGPSDVAVLINRSIIFSHSPSGRTVAPVDAIRIRFPHDMDSSSFSLSDDIVSFVGPQGTIDANGFEWLNPKTLEIRFEPQFRFGVYELVIGPEILDVRGKAMDVDLDSVPGEIPDDRYVAVFQIGAPRIVGHTPRGSVVGPVHSLRLNFDRDMDQSTFSVVDDILSFTGPQGDVAVTDYNWIDSETLELTFGAQLVPGTYQMVVGPQILDLAGNALNHDADFIAGEVPDDQYITTFNIAFPPRIVEHIPSGVTLAPVQSLRLVFDRDMDQSSFSLIEDIVSFTGPQGAIVPTGYVWLDGQTLEVTFDQPSMYGTYQMVVGPEIMSVEGIAMDQDGDSVVGEVPDDQYIATFDLTAPPQIVGYIPSGATEKPVRSLQFSFDHPMDQNSFSVAEDVNSFTGPQGSIAVTGYAWLDQQTLELTFDALLASGTYKMVLGPQILDLEGYPLDIDGDLIAGEVPDDQFRATFNIPVDLPATGQITSYAEGDDGDLQAGVTWPEPRFIDNENDTITDKLTGLMWIQNANLLGVSKTWNEALDYVSKMNAGEHENFGYTDWRMANILELESLVNSEVGNPATWLNNQGFTDVSGNDMYWSSSSIGFSTNHAYTIHLGYGGISSRHTGYYLLFWPVRSSEVGRIQLPQTGVRSSITLGDDGDMRVGVVWRPDLRFTDHGGGTVTDNLTGLMWTKNAGLANSAMTWQEALDYVASLNDSQYLGYRDWRLPNRNELRSLVDHSRWQPAISSGHPFILQGYWGNAHWSSTTYSSSLDRAWGVLLWSYGFAYAHYKTSQNNNVWPVRGRGLVGRPGIIAHEPYGSVIGPIDHIFLRFNAPMDTNSFSLEEDIASFIGPESALGPNGFSWVDDMTLEILFEPQVRAGTYEIVVGPMILDGTGNAMDQDNDLTAGEVPDDQYKAIFVIKAPQLVGYEPFGPGSSYDSIAFHFDFPMDQNSFSLDDILSFIGPQGDVIVTDYNWIDPETLEISFEPQSGTGEYEIVLGPGILDINGNPINQSTATFIIEAPRILGHTPSGEAIPPVSSIRFEFDRAMDASSFALTDDIVSFTSPSGNITTTGYAWVDSNTLEISFELQSIAGVYEITIGPQILDTWGNALDQDDDLVAGETPDDLYIASFYIEAPRVIAHTPVDKTPPPVNLMRFDFDRAMDQMSFSLADDIVSFKGPLGSLTVMAYSWMDSDTLEVTFEPQCTMGAYEMVLGPEILDSHGNAMDQDNDLVPGEVPSDQYTAAFTLAYSGTVTQDTTWGPEHGTIVVDGYLTVASGVTLTINQGTVVKFIGSNSGIIVNGVVNIEGTPQDRVILTSFKDDTAGGDTNADGAASSPSPGDWKGIAFCNTTNLSSLEGVEIRYSSEGACVGWWYRPPSGIARLRNAILRNNSKAIVARVAYSNIEAENCLVINNYEALALRNTAGVTLRNCTVVGNSYTGDVKYAVLTIENSIFAFNGAGFRNLNLLDDLVVRNSGFYGPDAQSMLAAVGEQAFRTSGNLNADPLFVDRQGGDYELSAGSPAIDAGRGVGASPTDILGHPRHDDLGVLNKGKGYPSYVDMGAYERQENTAAGDLAVTYVSDPNPEIVNAGDTFTIEWAISNVGTLDCNASWEDKVYLSDDPYIGSEDLTLGTYDHNVLLPSGSNYTREVNVIVPASTGPKYILVRANANNNLYEPVTMNNVLNSPSVLAVNVPTLKVGTPQTRTVSAGQWHYYRFEAQPGRSVLFTLGSSTSSCQIYLRHSLPPTISDYDATSEYSSGNTQEMRLLEPIEGTYYIGVYSQCFSANYTISADLTSLNIRRVSPDVASNAGRGTLKIEGDNFDPNTQVRLVGPGGTFDGQEYYQDSATLFTTFDLAAVGATVGLYDVVVTNPDAQTVTTYDAVTIEEGGAPDFTADLSMPGRCRPGRVINLTIDCTNPSRIDVNGPILTLDSGDAECQWQLPGNDNWVTGPDFRVMALSSEGPPTILRPSQTETITVKLRVPFRPGRLTVSLSSVGAIPTDGSNEPIDWDNLKEQIRPRWLESEAWEPVFLNLIDQVGHTWGDYAAMLRDNARYLSVLGSTVYDVASLFAFEVQQAQGLTCPRPILAEATDACGRAEGGCSCEAAGDASAATEGLMLSFTRVYRQSLASRYRVGDLGRGWMHNWEHSVVVDEEGNVTVLSPRGPGFFRRLPDRTYTSESCSVLTLEGGLYHLRLPDSRDLVFRSDGRLWYVDDEQGNRITAEYDGNRLTALVHSNGKRYTFEYDAHGRISQLTDCEGKVTTYVYDASGEHLVSVTNSDGTRRYTYATGMGLAREHALLFIEHLDGTNDYFEYDDLGRLAREYTGAGNESRTYRYDTAGGVTVTDETGASKTYFYDDSLVVQKSIETDALGRSTEVTMDPEVNCVHVRSPGGVTKTTYYDSQGNITAFTDPLGHRIELQYDPVTNRLLSVQDPRGNTISYTHDRNGNLTAITYPDATTLTYAYDDAGNLAETVNAQGQTTRYTYDDDGQLIRVDYSDGTSDTFTYDADGHLLTATDTGGTTTMQYDATGLLIRIEYPSGRYLAFSYDNEGRKTQMVDQDGFAVNYAYDADGQLVGLSDANGEAIVTYTYNTAGRVSRKDMGNGTYTTYGYDPASQLLHVINYAPDETVNSRFDYTYDELGRRTRMTTLEGTWTYGYDDADRLTSVTLPNGRLIKYEYDAAGNRISSTDGGVPTYYTTNNLDHYISVGSATYTYDADGNLREGASTSTYSFNEINKMTQVTTSDGTWIYEYDALGNRVATTHQGDRVECLVDPTETVDVVAEYDGTGNLVARYIHSPFGLVGRVDPNAEIAYYDFDALGNTVGITNPAGSYVNKYSYLPFGETVSSTEAIANPFTFVGQQGVMDEGNGLAFMRARYYNPRMGRFISRDPMGRMTILTRETNLYTYAANNPVSKIDPSGLKEVYWTEGYSYCQPGFGIVDRFPDDEPFGFDFSWACYVHDDCYGTCHDHSRLAQIRCDLKFLAAAQAVCYGPDVPWYARSLCLSVARTYAFGGAVGGSFGAYKAAQNNACGDEPPPDDTPDPNDEEQDEEDTDIQTSVSPEDKWGPAGYDTPDTPQGSELHYITAYEASQIFNYRIEIWNKPDAPVPTQDATIDDVLDSNVFDLSTFEFTRVGFLKWDVTLPGGQAVDVRVDCRPEMNIAVDITGSFDPETGRIDWWFHCVDPITGDYPDDPNAGFLPPYNPETGFEIGWMEFRVKPKEGLPIGTQLANQAFVQFDFLGPFGPAPKEGPWINTIDAKAPSSYVLSLPATTIEPNFLVEWTGQDDAGGSGIAHYDIYVSTDSGEFTIWLDDTNDRSAFFDGSVGRTFAFYSVAADNVGHVETPPVKPDAITTVISNRPPVANAGPDQIVERTSYQGAEVQLDGSDSNDPDGDALIYEWSWPGGSAVGMMLVVILPPGSTTVTLTVSDGQFSGTDTVNINVIDTTPPDVNIEVPGLNQALQDGVTLTAEAGDLSGVADVYLYIREPNDGSGVPIGYEGLPTSLNTASGKWERAFDTTQLPDGYYIILARAVDNYGNESWSEVVPFSIHNWAVVELLPASKKNKAGRTMPVKFSLRIAEGVDPAEPFVYNEELEIKVYDAADPGNILQTSVYGDSTRHYRIDNAGELYITNFKSKKKPAEYIVEIWRTSKNFLVGGFAFETVK